MSIASKSRGRHIPNLLSVERELTSLTTSKVVSTSNSRRYSAKCPPEYVPLRIDWARFKPKAWRRRKMRLLTLRLTYRPNQAKDPKGITRIHIKVAVSREQEPIQ